MYWLIVINDCVRILFMLSFLLRKLQSRHGLGQRASESLINVCSQRFSSYNHQLFSMSTDILTLETWRSYMLSMRSRSVQWDVFNIHHHIYHHISESSNWNLDVFAVFIGYDIYAANVVGPTPIFHVFPLYFVCWVCPLLRGKYRNFPSRFWSRTGSLNRS